MWAGLAVPGGQPRRPHISGLNDVHVHVDDWGIPTTVITPPRHGRRAARIDCICGKYTLFMMTATRESWDPGGWCAPSGNLRLIQIHNVYSRPMSTHRCPADDDAAIRNVIGLTAFLGDQGAPEDYRKVYAPDATWRTPG
jgi:hypothetical protein